MVLGALLVLVLPVLNGLANAGLQRLDRQRGVAQLRVVLALLVARELVLGPVPVLVPGLEEMPRMTVQERRQQQGAAVAHS